MSELIRPENSSKTELIIAKDILLRKIDIFLKNNICERCKESEGGIIVYPNGNKYCIHMIKEANKRFRKAYTELSFAFNNIEKD